MKGYIMEQITINEIQKYANELFLNIGGNVAHYSFIEYLNDLKNQEIIYDFYVIDSEDKFQYVIKFIPMAYYYQEILDRNSVFIYKPEKIEDKQDSLYKKYNELEQKIKDLNNSIQQLIKENNLIINRPIITASMVTEIMEKTNRGLIPVKEALRKTNGNIEEAIEILKGN